MSFFPTLNKPYSEDDLNLILNDALRVLEKIGIECSEPQAVGRVTAEAGIRHENGRLLFDPDAMRSHIADVRKRNAALPDEEPDFKLLTAWSCFNYADPGTGEVRPATTEDAILMTRLMDARGGNAWTVPLIPADVPPQHATLTADYIGAKYSRGMGGFTSVSSIREVELLVEMYQAVGRKYLFVEQVAISPLRFNDHGIAMALHFAERNDVDVVLSGAIPTVGSTAPISLRTAMAQSVAESMALSLVNCRLGLGEGGFGARLATFDMQHTVMGYGAPEEMLMVVLGQQIASFLNGKTYRIGLIHSTAHMPDSQAAVERTINVLGQALAGARIFRGNGQLAVDEVFSPQQAIIDDEIIAHVRHIVQGVKPLGMDGDVVEELLEGLETNQFLDAEATAENFREFYLFPELFHHYSTGHWRSEGCPTILGDAWEKAKAQIEGNDFGLSAEQERNVDAVYQRALKELA